MQKWKEWWKRRNHPLTVEQELELIMAKIDDLNAAAATLTTNAAALTQASVDLATRISAIQAGPDLQPATDAVTAAAGSIATVTTTLGTLAQPTP